MEKASQAQPPGRAGTPVRQPPALQRIWEAPTPEAYRVYHRAAGRPGRPRARSTALCEPSERVLSVPAARRPAHRGALARKRTAALAP